MQTKHCESYLEAQVASPTRNLLGTCRTLPHHPGPCLNTCLLSTPLLPAGEKTCEPTSLMYSNEKSEDPGNSHAQPLPLSPSGCCVFPPMKKRDSLPCFHCLSTGISTDSVGKSREHGPHTAFGRWSRMETTTHVPSKPLGPGPPKNMGRSVCFFMGSSFGSRHSVEHLRSRALFAGKADAQRCGSCVYFSFDGVSTRAGQYDTSPQHVQRAPYGPVFF